MKNKQSRAASESPAQGGAALILDEGTQITAFAKEDTSAKWQKMFPVGVTKYRADFPGGKIVFDEKYLGQMAANYVAMGKPQLQVNFNHRGSTSSFDVAPIDAKVAAGWITDVRLDEEGLHALIKWNERAREYILADEFRYLSPEFATEYRNTNTGKTQGPTLLGAALLNDPFLRELPRVAASDSQPAPEANQGAVAMDKICAALGLPADADEVKVLEAIEALKGKKEEPEPEEAKKMAELQTSVTTFAEENKKLTSRVALLEGEKKLALASSYVAELVKSGKIDPVQSEAVAKFALADMNGCKAVFDKAPTKQLGEVGVSHGVESIEAEKKLLSDKWAARVEELKKTGMKFEDASRAALNENPRFATIFA